MKNTFEIAMGSIIGRDHRLVNKNNQDASCIRADEESIIAVVCDGCSDGRHSEVGAKIGSRFVVEEIRKSMIEPCQMVSDNFWETIRQNVLARIRCLCVDMGGSFPNTVNHYFLFTVIGFIVTKNDFAFFSIGDGFARINDEEIRLGPFEGNEPPYLGYALLDSSLTRKDPDQLKFNLIRTMKQEQLFSAIIGSDGAGDLAGMAGRTIPGKDDIVGPLERFISNGKYYTNKDMLRRKLAIINKDSVKFVRNAKSGLIEARKENGLLRDDTTIVSLRRR